MRPPQSLRDQGSLTLTGALHSVHPVRDPPPGPGERLSVEMDKVFILSPDPADAEGTCAKLGEVGRKREFSITVTITWTGRHCN